jgi:beta-N-acetylhexosaminidase
VSELAEAVSPLPDFENAVRQRLTRAPEVIFLDARANDASAALDASRKAEVTVIALAVRAKSGAGTIAVPRVARAAIEQMHHTIAISFGSPYLIREIPNVETYICAYGIQPPLQLAVADALFGEIDLKGTLPVTIQS